MTRQRISLKARVRYEGRVQTFDRRAITDLEKIPNPVWRTVGQVLRSKFRKPVPVSAAPPKPSKNKHKG
jgi:hypothetical protein